MPGPLISVLSNLCGGPRIQDQSIAATAEGESMRINTSAAVAASLLFAAAAHNAAAAATDAELERAPAASALPSITQKLFDALAPGDKAVWERYLSPRFEEIDESGARLTREQLMKDFGPLPPGMSGSIGVLNAQVSDFGAFAVMRYDLDEHELVYKQTLHVLYRATDTWRREGGKWRLVASQTMTVAQDPPPLPISAALLGDYAGLYDEDGQRRYRVALQGDHLALGREGRELKPLIAVGDNVFVAQGDPLAILYIFVRGADGKVQRLVERRKFADLQMTRIAEAAAS